MFLKIEYPPIWAIKYMKIFSKLLENESKRFITLYLYYEKILYLFFIDFKNE